MIRRLVVAAATTAGASLVFSGSLGAQTGVLSGVIYDQTNKAGLPGVEVRIKGTDLVATTRTDGRFTIASVPAGSHQVEATREGFRPFRLPLVKVMSADTARVQLAMAAADPVRVDAESQAAGGFAEDGTRRRVLTEKLVSIGAASDETTGRIVVDGTNITSLGEVSKNAPLYIIDGVLLSPGLVPRDFDGLNIKSIEVIKGAAAESEYGSRAANGVIRITTKKIPD